MTMQAHYVADDFEGGIWQPHGGILGAYVLPSQSLVQTAFPRSRVRFRNALYFAGGADILANLPSGNLCPVLGGGFSFEAVAFLTKDHSEFVFLIGPPNVAAGDGVIVDFNSAGYDINVTAGSSSVEASVPSAWTNATAWKYITVTIDLSITNKQIITVYDSTTQAGQLVNTDPVLAEALRTWTPLSQPNNIEISIAGQPTGNGLIEFAVHDRVLSAAEVNFRTTYFRVLNGEV